MWQMGGIGPFLGQAHHFLHFQKGKAPTPRSDTAAKRSGSTASRSPARRTSIRGGRIFDRRYGDLALDRFVAGSISGNFRTGAGYMEIAAAPRCRRVSRAKFTSDIPMPWHGSPTLLGGRLLGSLPRWLAPGSTPWEISMAGLTCSGHDRADQAGLRTRPENSLEIFLGDYVDRGRSRGVVEWMAEAPLAPMSGSAWKPRTCCSARSTTFRSRTWLFNGGETLLSA